MTQSTNESRSAITPLLSIVMTARDDDYTPDLRYRISTTLNYFGRVLKRLNHMGDVEIVVVDWGSETPLSQTLTLSPEALTVVRFIYISPSDVETLIGDRLCFHVTLAANVGLRRARGDFLMISGSDLLAPQQALDALLTLLQKNSHLGIDPRLTYFFVRRVHVPWQFAEREPSLDEWERYLMLNAAECIRDIHPACISSGAGGLLMSRQLWHEVRGLDETFTGYGANDVDLGLRVSHFHPWVDLTCVGVTLFHMQHRPNVGGRANALASVVNNRREPAQTFAVNDVMWGAANHNFPIQTSFAASDHVSNRNDNAVLGSLTKCFRRLERVDDSTADDHPFNVARCNEVLDSYAMLKSQYFDWTLDKSTAEALCLVAWYSRLFYPRRFLDFDLNHGLATLLTGTACPSTEIYGVTGEQPMYPNWPESIAYLREAIGHKGYVRIIKGNSETAFTRLSHSSFGESWFDLIYLPITVLNANVDSIRGLLGSLSIGGALVLTNSCSQHLESCLSKLHPFCSEFLLLRCNPCKAVVMVRWTNELPSLNSRSVTMASPSSKQLHARLAAIERRVLGHRLLLAVRRPHRYPVYLNRAINSFLGRK